MKIMIFTMISFVVFVSNSEASFECLNSTLMRTSFTLEKDHVSLDGLKCVFKKIDVLESRYSGWTKLVFAHSEDCLNLSYESFKQKRQIFWLLIPPEFSMRSSAFIQIGYERSYDFGNPSVNKSFLKCIAQ